MSRRSTAALFVCGASLAGLTIIGLLLQLEDRRDQFLIVVALQSAVYAIAVRLAWNGGSRRRIIFAVAALAIFMRIPVVLAPPYLSSDIYRYVWDGHIEAEGLNPYRYAPTDPRLTSLRDANIYPQVVSKDAP